MFLNDQVVFDRFAFMLVTAGFEYLVTIDSSFEACLKGEEICDCIDSVMFEGVIIKVVEVCCKIVVWYVTVCL